MKWYAFRFLLVCSLHGVSIAASWGLGLRSKEVVKKVTYTSDEKDHINLASLAYNYVYKDKIPTDMTYKDKKVEDILSTEAYELPSKIFETGKGSFSHKAEHASKHLKKGLKYFQNFFSGGKASSIGKALKNTKSAIWKGLMAVKSTFRKSNFKKHKPPLRHEGIDG